MDFGSCGSRSVDMDDTDEIVIRLCTKVGIIMEDMSIVALTIRGLSSSERTDAIVQISIAAETIQRLTEAARVLSR